MTSAIGDENSSFSSAWFSVSPRWPIGLVGAYTVRESGPDSTSQTCTGYRAVIPLRRDQYPSVNFTVRSLLDPDGFLRTDNSARGCISGSPIGRPIHRSM